MTYQFWNTSVSSEKQLLKWLGQAPEPTDKEAADTSSHSINTDGVVLKQEVVDPADSQASDELAPDDMTASGDAQEYILQQQQLPYQPFEFQQDGFADGEASANTAGPSATVTSEAAETPPKRKRRAAAMKPLPRMDSDDEDDPDMMDTKIAKTEEQSDDSGAEEPETTAFVGLPDNEQPGPSGVGKGSSDTPCSPKVTEEVLIKEEPTGESRAESKKANKQKRAKRAWPCAKCKETFRTLKLLKIHRKVHRRQEDDIPNNYRFDEKAAMFVCNTCDVEMADKKEMEKHMLVHEEKFTCEVCKKEFIKPYEYTSHVYEHDQSKDFCCPLCKYTTHRRPSILIHINTCHLRRYSYTCTKCGKGFNSCMLYKEHNNVHEGVKPFRCVVCSKAFAFSSYLSTHQIRNHSVTIGGMIGLNQCSICHKRFSRMNALEKHIKRHKAKETTIREKRHLCDVCGKGFATKEKLKAHYRVHTGDKPYTCSYCGKSFTKRDYLVIHERVHNGEKPYSCEYCGKCFSQGAPLRIHVRSHTGERPYVCHICKAGFMSKGALNVHFQNCRG